MKDKIHIPNKEGFKHDSDFRVKYRFYTRKEGGRESVPHQGIRSDFWYEHDNHTMDGMFIIHPEFEDAEGKIIEQGPVLEEGFATMWILNPYLRKYHQERIKIGAVGYFMEGGLRTAICEVVEIIDLMSNPTSF